MQQLTRSASIMSWALHPYGEFSGSRFQKGVITACVLAAAAYLVGVSIENEAAYERDTAIVEKAAAEDGFSLADRVRIKDGHATVALKLGNCVFGKTVVTITNGDITSYEFLIGNTDSYHRNQPGAPQFAHVRTSKDMPLLTTLNEKGQTIACVSK